MKRVGVCEARTHFHQLLTEVERTRSEIIIQRRGKDVAVLRPYLDTQAALSEEEGKRIIEGLREIRAHQRRPKPGETAKSLIEQGRKR